MLSQLLWDVIFNQSDMQFVYFMNKDIWSDPALAQNVW